jgi:hypothetical protein
VVVEVVVGEEEGTEEGAHLVVTSQIVISVTAPFRIP